MTQELQQLCTSFTRCHKYAEMHADIHADSRITEIVVRFTFGLLKHVIYIDPSGEAQEFDLRR